MFKKPIVIIVGAGAGVEYNMPLGSTLASTIANAARFRFEHYSMTPTSGDADLFNILFRLYQQDKAKLDSFTGAGNDLAAALSSSVSVDDALYQLSENAEAVTLGKLCIIRAILKAERNSSIAISTSTGRVDDAAGRDGWVEQLFSMAISNLKRNEIPAAFSNVTFVNFNYDRCIEHYLWAALQRIGFDQGTAETVIGEIKMIRPYGSVGSILPGSPDYVSFGGNVDPFKAQSRIRTYTESEALHDSTKLESALQAAALVMILGFGYHPQNLSLLQMPDPRQKFVMTTVKKVHQANLADIKNAISETLRVDKNDVELFDMTAPEMLRDLRLKIMMRVG